MRDCDTADVQLEVIVDNDWAPKKAGKCTQTVATCLYVNDKSFDFQKEIKQINQPLLCRK